MIDFVQLFHTIVSILNSKQFFLIAELLSFITINILGILLIQKFNQKNEQMKHYQCSFFLLLLIVFGFSVENLAWIIKLSHQLELASFDFNISKIFTTFAWIFDLIRYQALGLFVENLIEKKFTFRLHQKIFLIINSFLIICLLRVMVEFFYSRSLTPEMGHLVTLMIRSVSIYYPLSLIPSIVTAFIRMQNKEIPIILKKQLKIFLNYIIFPHLIFELLQSIPFFSDQGSGADTAGIFAAASVLFMSYAIIFCTIRIIRFRFFNFFTTVQSKPKISFTSDFKDTIEHLSLATNTHELSYITQNFFKESFQTPMDHVCLHIRNTPESCNQVTSSYCDKTNEKIESFINNDSFSFHPIEFLKKYRILVADEVAFDAYYSRNQSQNELSQFLINIESELFLPIYNKNIIVAHLTVKRNPQHKFYSHTEQNKIAIFGTYLASAINILNNNNTLSLLNRSKEIKEELYLKHQEINQYKESIKTLLKQKTNSNVGIIFYKNDRFTLGNAAAQSLLPVNLNQQKKHPINIAISKLAQQVEAFRNTQTRLIYDNNNKQLIISGIPHIDQFGGAILTIQYPDASDIIKTQIDRLQDPSQWDYFLYLETTKSGKLINQLIPSNSEVLLNFKIKLLEIALNRKAILLQSHSDDLLSMVDIIHHISLRDTLHIIELKPTTLNHDLAIKLFGINPILMQNPEKPLLEKLDNNGTLFIKNVEHLDLESQKKLAHYIKYGLFTVVKGEQTLSSDVRIICSVSQNPHTLMKQEKLSPLLYQELSETEISMPSLLTIDEKELQELIDGFARQAMQENDFTNLLQITDKEKEDLIDRRPASLQEFKAKIRYLLTQKSKDNHIFHETHFDPNFNVTNPKLLKAARLGKHSLKDATIMSMLWEQFQSQNKIAQFLGVNRSSVNRRCKEYNLL